MVPVQVDSDLQAARESSVASRIDLFRELDTDEHARISPHLTRTTLNANQIIFAPDQSSHLIYVLLHGIVNLYRLTPDGRKIIVVRLHPQSVFGNLKLSEHMFHSSFAEAQTTCELVSLPVPTMRETIVRNSHVGLKLIEQYGARLAALHAEIEEIAFSPLSTRLAALILADASADGILSGFTQKQIADRLGTYRETVSDVLRQFREAGAIAISPKRIVVLKADLLRAMANMPESPKQ